MIRGFVTGMGIGAGLMYFFDPEQGRRRRSLFEDRLTRIRNSASRATQVITRDLRSRTNGLVAEFRGLFNGRHGVSDKMQETWSPTAEFIVGGGAAALILYGLVRGSSTTAILGGAAMGVLAQRMIGTETATSQPRQPRVPAERAGASIVVP